MAKIGQMAPEWYAWVRSRPSNVQDLCRKLPPDTLYMIKATGQRCTIASYCEDGTVTVDIEPLHNPDKLMFFPINVFGYGPDDLEECDLPPDGERARALPC